MKYRTFKIGLFIIFSFGLLVPWNSILISQNYRFKTYGPDDGLGDNFIYTITQDENGFLWLGTGEGISRFDGFNFIKSFPGDSLPDSPVRKSFIDSGKRTWFGFDNGLIAVLEGISFRLLTPIENQRSAIKGFAEDQKGNVLVATQGKGIIRVGKEYELSYINQGFEGQLITSVCMLRSGELLTGTFEGLFLFKYFDDRDEVELIKRFDEIPFTNIQTIYNKENKDHYWVGTEDEGLFRVTEEGDGRYSISPTGQDYNLNKLNIQDVFQDDEGSIWLATEGQGAVKLKIDEKNQFVEKTYFNEHNGLGTPYIKSIFEDYEGNLWFASYGGGLIVLNNQAFLFYSIDAVDFNNNISSLLVDNDTYWLGGEKEVIKIDITGKTSPVFFNTRSGLPEDKITALIKDDKGVIWIGTNRNGIYYIQKNANKANRFFVSSNSLENVINSFAYKNSKLFAATNGGLFIFDLESGETEKLTTSEGLPHNRIRHVYIDSKGKTWIATRSNGIYNLETKNELTIESWGEMEFVSITEDNNGNLWAATNGEGVFLFAPDSLEQYTAADGLRSNYCYSLSADANGMIWVGHRMGMSRIDPFKRIVQEFSVDQGITVDFNYNSVTRNSRNNVVFGTSQGIIVYDHSREKYNNVPPKLNITSLKISDLDYDFTRPVELPYNIYKIRIDFIGINLRNPEKVTYQYRLEGYDDWSDPTSIPYVVYSRVEDGDYTFLLRACNEAGICTEIPLSLKISIKIPPWKTWWFVLTVFIIIVSSVYVIIKLRERKQRKIQEYLQRALDERTKEVMEQKEEIENKNRDITDSINYAQRIQASILPPVKRLQDHFTGSFVFYQPKDIVSGDFYWYDRVWGNKFLIVCADSTGHGVPGAFMSMIGTTLIKDICARKDVRSPSDLLLTLDLEIKEALNQNREAERSNDGMDIIVAEINLSTNELCVASAMRPLIIYTGGEQIYVKGSRSSVGGRMDEGFEDKEFIDEKYALRKGDIVYMFSDGYPDQFGGPLGKKFKMVRLKNLLRDIHDKPMDEQYNYIKNNFMLWKEDLEQVDDVLFMGIKI